MSNEKFSLATREALAKITKTNANDWFLVFRARHGFEAVLQAVAELRGNGEVITQALTCTTALNPILSAGHVPVYIDTSPDDLSLDTSKLQASAASRAIIMQHSFGIESNITKARVFANKHKLVLLEDSAHCAGFMARDKDGQPLADVSVHSFGVEKLFSTKFGGAVWINPDMKDETMRETIRKALSSLPVIGRATRARARHYRFFNRLLNHTPKFVEKIVRDTLIKLGLFEQAIMPEELAGKNHGKAAKPDTRIIKEMLDALRSYEKMIEKRRNATDVYLTNPPSNLTLPKSVPKKDFAPVRLPLLCENQLEATRLFDVLRDNGHYSGKWYNSTIFPDAPDKSLYNYDPDLCPVAENLATRMLNLPTNISTEEAKEILDVLHRETD